MDTVLPSVSLQQLDEVCTRLRSADIIEYEDLHEANLRHRWRCLPQDPSQSEEAEGEAFKFLEDITQSVIKKLDLDIPRNISLAVTGQSTPVGFRRNASRPDGYLHRINKGSKRVQWADIIMPMEFKKSYNTDCKVDDFGKVMWSMHHVMRNDARRRHVYGLTCENTKARLWFNNRSDVVASEEFDINTNWRHLVRIILSMLLANPVELGYDFSIERLSGNDETSEPLYNITVHNNEAKTTNIYRAIRVISDVGADSMVGRTTRVWEVKKLVDDVPTGPSYALKDAWVYEDREEHRLLNKIRMEQPGYAKHFLTPIDYGFVPRDPATPSIPDSTHKPLGHQRQLKPTRILLRTHNGIGVAYTSVSTRNKSQTGTTGASRDSVGHSDDIPSWSMEGHRDSACLSIHSRWHYRIVFEEIGTPVHDLRVFAEVFTAIQGGWEGLHAVHLSKYVHRDVSSGNVLLVPASGILNERGVIMDLEYGKEIDDTSAPHDVRTGTKAFMATEVEAMRHHRLDSIRVSRKMTAYSAMKGLLEQSVSNPTNLLPAFRHNPLHDMESFWWLCMWIMFYLVPSGASDRDWLGDYQQVFRNSATKLACLTTSEFDKYTTHIPSELTSQMRGWLAVLNQIYTIAYTKQEDSTDPMKMIRIDDEAIEESYTVGKIVLERLQQASIVLPPMITLKEQLEVAASTRDSVGNSRQDSRQDSNSRVKHVIMPVPKKRRQVFKK
ncbi:unnamed protein product [Rhizoctonia solani]|uniref:Fungal-type protein kinase domain-containing protein n=1 Tax=Rhizoctonia solani TaxID=456999 RepID=A0A8H3BTF3_9AGAM|nr:unnamed protein product [Rhizoctonia solani]